MAQQALTTAAAAPAAEPRVRRPPRYNNVDRETAHWRDTGCHIHPSCLSCPLPRCIYDGPDTDGVEAAQRMTVRQLFASGLDGPAIARQLRISIRTVYRLRYR